MIKAIVNEVHQGIPLSEENALILYEKAPLHQLLQAAHEYRLKVNPNSEVTYLVDRNINYTNVCTINCQFCSFYRPPGHDETYTQEINEISDRVTELEQIGGSRILMQGGVNPSLGMNYYLNLLKQLRENTPPLT